MMFKALHRVSIAKDRQFFLYIHIVCRSTLEILHERIQNAFDYLRFSLTITLRYVITMMSPTGLSVSALKPWVK